MDIHYILLYHIQVDITTAQDEGKLIQQHKTWPCFTTKNNYVRNWISHFPISHSLSLIYIPFLLLLDYRCFVRSVGSDQCHQCQWRHQCTQIEAIDIWWKTKLWIETPNKPPNNKCWNPAMTRNRIRIRNGCVWIRSEETKALWCRQDKTAGVFPIAIIAARLDWIYHVARTGGEGYRYHPICWVRRRGHWTSLGCGIHPPLGWN